jgi:general secretion pathway protein J
VKRSAGFTLIEMTVALALLGFIALLVFDSLRFGQRSYESSTRKGAAAWQVFASQRLIRNLIETAYPQQPDAIGATIEHGLAGEAQRLAITAAAPLASGGAGLYRYEIALRAHAEGGNDLVIRWRAQLAGTADEASYVEEVLIERVAGLSVSYESGAGWSERWFEPMLPRLVRVKVSFAAGDSRRWPDLIGAPRLTDDANCIFDAIARRCRVNAS